MKQIRTCENCFHFTAGVCKCPVPVSIVGIRWRVKVKPTDGAHCDAHRMKSTRQKKLKLVSPEVEAAA